MRALLRLICLWSICAAPAPVRADDDVARAREHYRSAIKAYEVAQYDEAIREFAEAYKIKDDPTILFNLAQSHRLAGHRTEALATYRMFLLKVPNAPNRHEVEAMITNLQQHGRSEDPDRELAHRYAAAGAAKFAAQQYQEAVVEFEKARLVKPSPALDLDIARSYDRLGRFEEAVASYRLYVESKPEPANAGEIRSRISVLEERLAASAQPVKPALPPSLEPVAPPPPRPPIDAHAGRAKTLAGIAVGAIGVAALAGGVACGILSQQAGDALTKLDQTGGTFDPAKESAGKSEQIAAGVLLGVGGVALVTGVVLVILGRREAHAARVAVTPSVGRGAAALDVRWTF